jgi:hypothetical protein
MATTDTRQHTTWGTRFRFLSRAIGLTGALALAVGVAMAFADDPQPGTTGAMRQRLDDVVSNALNGTGTQYGRVAGYLVGIGLVAVVAALAVELLGALFLVTGRRTAAGTSATIATAAVVALLVLVNVYSFNHHRRYDFTRDRQFTLPPDLAKKLRTLRSESPTTVVVLQKHRIFGTLTDDRDAFTKAAEEKVTEKVKDLVDLLREFGPRFNVAVLDTEAYAYKEQFDELTKDAPELKAAIEAAPENSIFFHANKRVQRLAFNEFLQLDKTASKEANGGRGNLVLLPQGVENFARRVLAVQERRPKVAVCVVHELLTTAHTEGKTYTMAGLKKTLTEHGFDVIDVVLKKNWANAGSIDDLKPAADTREESKLERLQGELATAEDELTSARGQARLFEQIQTRIAELKGRPWSERSAFYRQILRGTVTEELEPEVLKSIARQAERARQALDEAQKERKAAEDKLKEALKDERPLQDRRITDVKAKFARVLADVDLIVVPRFTVEDATESPGVSANLHNLSKEQAEVIRDFMKSGRPVLACLGPVSGRTGPTADASDDFEKLLAERGIELGRDLVLFDGEAKAFSSRRAGEQFGGGGPNDIPPLVFADAPAGAAEVKPNPVAAAARLTARSVDQKLDLKMRALRPVYLAPGWQNRIPFAAEFTFTSPDSWNEERPFPQLRVLPDGTPVVTGIPRYEPTPLDDPKKGTRDEERRGPFPIGVAIESKIPAAWVNEQYAREQFAAALVTPLDAVYAAGLTVAAEKLDRPTQRLVVIGSGNIFSGPKLEPPQEKLLLHSVNWLTGREDRLPRADLPAWSFPRVQLSDRDLTLWRAGAFGLPLVAVFLGLMMMMVRRLR